MSWFDDDKTVIKIDRMLHKWASGKATPAQVHKYLKGLGYKTNLNRVISGEAPVWKIGGGKEYWVGFKRGGLVSKRK